MNSLIAPPRQQKQQKHIPHTVPYNRHHPPLLYTHLYPSTQLIPRSQWEAQHHIHTTQTTQTASLHRRHSTTQHTAPKTLTFRHRDLINLSSKKVKKVASINELPPSPTHMECRGSSQVSGASAIHVGRRRGTRSTTRSVLLPKLYQIIMSLIAPYHTLTHQMRVRLRQPPMTHTSMHTSKVERCPCRTTCVRLLQSPQKVEQVIRKSIRPTGTPPKWRP